jgi:hypothetical protein
MKALFKLNKFSQNLKNSKYFSTLIIPEIAGNKIHPSINNLVTAANQLDNEVNKISNTQTHILLYGNELSEDVINSAKKIKNIKKILLFKNENLKNP